MTRLRSLAQFNDTNSTPFVAVVDLSSTRQTNLHDLQFRLADSQRLELIASTRVLSPAVADTCLLLLNEILVAIHETSNAHVRSPYLKPTSRLLSVDSQDAALLAPFNPAPNWVDEHATSTPHAPAVIFYPTISVESVPETMTYRQLSVRSSQMAHFLIRQGVIAGDKVAVCMKRNLNFHITLNAIFKSGACYVPIDLDLPSARKRYIAEDSDSRFVIVEEPLPYDSTFAVMVCYPEEAALGSLPKTFHRLISPDSLAYMLYTSGTSGNPKGCLVMHKGLHAAISAMAKICEDITVRETDRYLGLASIAFDVHIAEIYIAWKLGITAATALRTDLLEDLANGISILGVTHMACVPSLIEATFGKLKANVGQVKYLTSGGEKMTDSVLDNWSNRSGFRLVNFYGPSEASIGCTVGVMDPTVTRENIGRIFPGSRAFVVSSDLQIVPRCTIGELVIEGVLVGAGYHKLPDKTANTFLNWPTSEDWAYRTGDLARMMPDGSLEILGRTDSQIKLRGVRIEAEGVSNVLRKAALGLAGEDVDVQTMLAPHPFFAAPQLVSLVAPSRVSSNVPTSVKKSDHLPEVLTVPKLVQALRSGAQRDLPGYMVPSHIIPISWIPLSSNGKANESLSKALFANIEPWRLGNISKQNDPHKSLSRGEIVDALIDVLAETSGIPKLKLSPESHFFECGLDSLKLISFSKKIRKRLGIFVPVATLMEEPTIASTARVIQAQEGQGGPTRKSQRPSVSWTPEMREEIQQLRPATDIENILPTFPVQDGVLYRSMEDATYYVQHVVCRLTGETDVERVKEAWKTTQGELEILRTTFYIGGQGEIAQIILKAHACRNAWHEQIIPKTAWEDFNQWFHTNLADSIARALTAEFHSSPPFRLTKYASGNGNFVVLSIHHALYDGSSLPFILQRVSETYLGSPSPPVPSMSYVLESVHNPEDERAEEFWTEFLKGFHGIKASDDAYSSKASTSRRHLNLSLTRAAELAAAANVTLQALLCQAFAMALSKDGNGDLIFGLIRSGRAITIPYVEDAPFPLVSVVPMRVQLRSIPSFFDPKILSTVQESITKSQRFQHTRLRHIQNAVTPGCRLFDTVFSLTFISEVSSRLWTLEVSQPRPDHALACEFQANEHKDSLSLLSSFSSKHWSESAVGELEGRIEHILAAWCSPNTESPPLSWRASPLQHQDNRIEGAVNTPLITFEDTDAAVQHLVMKEASALLGVTEGTYDPLTSLLAFGLDSIKAILLSRRLRQRDINIAPTKLMLDPTIRGIANNSVVHSSPVTENTTPVLFVLNQKDLSLATEVTALHPLDKYQLCTTTALQNGMLSQTVASEGSLYVHSFPMEFLDDMDIRKLQHAWTELIRRLSILRTTFHYSLSRAYWVQAVHSQYDIVLHNLSSGTVKEGLSELSATMLLKTESEFSQPPYRVGIMTTYTGRLIHVLVMHHALYDGASIAILFDELQRLYHGAHLETAVQFFDILPQMLNFETKGLNYWSRLLRGFRCSEFPRDAEHPSSAIFRKLRTSTVEAKALCRQLRVTVQAVAQSALWKLLSQLHHSRDITFGHVIAGRDFLTSESVIGPMLNTIPCRMNMTDTTSLTHSQLVSQFHRQYTSGAPWQHSSLRLLRYELQCANLWDTIFLYNVHSPRSGISFWRPVADGDIDVHVQYGLNVEVTVGTEFIELTMAVAPGVMSEPELENITRDFDEHFSNIVENPDTSAIGSNPTTYDLRTPHPQKVDRTSVSSFGLRADSRSELEAAIAECTNIPVEQIDPHAGLATIGIDSVLAIQLSSRLRRKGFLISAADIVNAPSIVSLAQRLVGRSQTPKSQDLSPVDSNPAPELSQSVYLKPTPGMKWFIAGWQKSGGFRYQHGFAFRAKKRLDPTLARESWRKLVQRHQILRAAIRNGERGDVCLAVLGGFSPGWTEETRDFVADETEWIVSRMRKALVEAIDLRTPPTNCMMLRLPVQDYLIIYLHHFQYDAWSIPLLMQDYENIYHGAPCKSIVDPESPLREEITARAQAQEYWRTVFEEPLVIRHIPKCSGRGDTQEIPGARVAHQMTYNFPGIRYLSLKAQKRPPLSSFFIAAWAIVQHALCETSDVVFALWQTGRSGLDPAASELLAAPCVNILPLRVKVDTPHSIAAVASRIHRELQRRHPAAVQTDLEEINEWIEGEGKPLCNVSVNITVQTASEEHTSRILESVEVPYEALPSDSRCRTGLEPFHMTNLIKDDLTLDIIYNETHEALTLHFEADRNYVDVARAEALGNQWADILRSALSTPGGGQ